MLAAELGLPMLLRRHFAPDLLLQALQIYRRASRRPSSCQSLIDGLASM